MPFSALIQVSVANFLDVSRLVNQLAVTPVSSGSPTVKAGFRYVFPLLVPAKIASTYKNTIAAVDIKNWHEKSERQLQQQ